MIEQTCLIRLAYVNGGRWLMLEYLGIALRRASWVSTRTQTSIHNSITIQTQSLQLEPTHHRMPQVKVFH